MKRIVPANSVPAAAVIRGGQALFEMIGRKEHVDGFYSRHSGNISVLNIFHISNIYIFDISMKCLGC